MLKNVLAYHAAVLEEEQAERDFAEEFDAFVTSGARAGSPQDYAVWAAGGYVDTTARLVRAMPVWEA